MGIFSDNSIDNYDNIDLINIILGRISRQIALSEEDRRVITHLNECLFQLNLKEEKNSDKEAKKKGQVKTTVKRTKRNGVSITQKARGSGNTMIGVSNVVITDSEDW